MIPRKSKIYVIRILRFFFLNGSCQIFLRKLQKIFDSRN